MNNITGYSLIVLGVIMAVGGFALGGPEMAMALFIGVVMFLIGVTIISKNKATTDGSEQDGEKSTRQYPRNGFVLAAAIISLFVSMTIALSEINQFMGSSSAYAIIEAFGGMMALQGILTIASCVLFFVGWWKNAASQVLAGAILSCAAAAFMMLYIPFYILPIVFGFVGYVKVKNK